MDGGVTTQMILPELNKRMRNNLTAVLERGTGETGTYMHFEYENIIENTISNTSKLPSETRSTLDNIQDSSGNPYFTFGYSQFGGGHSFK